VKTIKTAPKDTTNDICRAEDSLKETEASIGETTSDTLLLIEQGDTSIHPPRGCLKLIIPSNKAFTHRGFNRYCTTRTQGKDE